MKVLTMAVVVGVVTNAADRPGQVHPDCFSPGQSTSSATTHFSIPDVVLNTTDLAWSRRDPRSSHPHPLRALIIFQLTKKYFMILVMG